MTIASAKTTNKKNAPISRTVATSEGCGRVLSSMSKA